MRQSLFLAYLLLAALGLQAQDSTLHYYRSPLSVDMPILLAGNFGELRGNHFHAGLDFRVGGSPGAKLFAVADGYVSRISVSPEGYGKAVYINHPNGTTSVYGHLHTFSPIIKKHIENIQYKRQKFAVDEILEPNTIPLKKGDIIGIAGNSGSSFGAHLHFELRKTATQAPFNVLTSGIYKVTDNIAPAIKRVVFYKYEEENEIPSIEPFLTTIAGLQKTIDVPENFFIAVDASDRQNGTNGKFDINRMEVKLDKKIIFAYRIDAFRFEDARYINSLIAYDQLQISSHPLIKTYIEPGNKLANVYDKVENRGIITLSDTVKHLMEVVVYDDYNNSSSCTFTLQRRDYPTGAVAYSEEIKPGTIMYHHHNNKHEQEGLSLTIPAGALYRPIRLIIDTTMYTPPYAKSPVWNIHSNEVPLHSMGATLHLQADIPEAIQNKAIIVGITKTGGIKAVGGEWSKDGVSAKINSFGDYCVTIDTTAPAIRPLFKKGADLRKCATLSIKISDNLSGIISYKAFIDGEWALMDYDAKKNVLVYTFDPQRIKRNTKHTLLLSVSDKCMNTAGLETNFTW